MALDDIYMLTHVQHFVPTGEQAINNYFYVKDDPAGSAQDLVDAWVAADGVQDKQLAIQSNSLATNLVRVINLGSLIDFAENTTAKTGTSGGAGDMPMFNAVNFTLRLNTRAVRPGSKRIAGMCESFQSGGVFDDPDYIAALNAFGVALVSDVAGADANYRSAVVKRVLRVADEDHPTDRYTLPETDEELVYGRVVAFLVNMRVSHQVSRGNGR